MASCTRKVTNVRERKMATNGKAAKNKVRRLGTTAPNLPLNKPNAHESAFIAKRAAKTAAKSAAKSTVKSAAKI